MSRKFKCLLCDKIIEEGELNVHKWKHKYGNHYGIMWPLGFMGELPDSIIPNVSTYESFFLAQKIGVKKVYIRDEGQNPSGSMKDYIVGRALENGVAKGFSVFTVVSSGNHAASLASLAGARGLKSIVFVPATSSKIDFLSSFDSNLVIGVEDAIFEEVYVLANRLELSNIYNANVSNEALFTCFAPIANNIAKLDPMPTHILSGVGNGSYLAGIAWGLEKLELKDVKIVPVGMEGAFPTEYAFKKGAFLYEYTTFQVEEKLIDAAEGSIAIASYSMPQLIQGLRTSNGFTLGGLTNIDLAKAYRVLFQDKGMKDGGVIPEPTGIMGLAAALKYKKLFSRDDILLISFTGHGVKDLHGIASLVPDIFPEIEALVKERRQDLLIDRGKKSKNIIIVGKDVESRNLKETIQNWAIGGNEI